MTLAAVLCCAMTTMVFTACTETDNPVVAEEEEMPDIEPVDNTPKNDVMTTTTATKAYVFDGEYGDIGNKLINRLTNRQQELDSTTMLIVFPGNKINTLSQSEKNHIIKAYNKGAKILVDRPSRDEMIWIAYVAVIEDSTAIDPVKSVPDDEEVPI